MKKIQHWLMLLVGKLQTRSTIVEKTASVREYTMEEAAYSKELPEYIREAARRRLAELYVYH